MSRALLILAVLAGCGGSERSRRQSPEQPPSPIVEPVPAETSDAPPPTKPAVKEPPAPRGVEVESLEALAPLVPDAAVHVAAADAPADLIAMHLRWRDQSLVGRPSGKLVTGRIAVERLETAYKALASREPTVARLSVEIRGGRARRVDLRLQASSFQVLGLLYEVLGANLAYIGNTQPLIVAVSAQRTDVLIDRIERELGLTRKRHGSTNFVSADPTSKPDPALLAIKGRRIRLAADGATAGELADLVAEATAVAVGAPCNGGRPVSVRLRSERIGVSLAAVSLIGGQAIAKKRQRCVGAAPRAPRDGDSLVAIVQGRVDVAGIRSTDGKFIVVRDGDAFSVGGDPIRALVHNSGVAFGNVSLRLADRLGWEKTRDEHLARGRLAATIITRRERTAIIDLGGSFAQVSQTPKDSGYSISPGRLTFRLADKLVHLDLSARK